MFVFKNIKLCWVISIFLKALLSLVSQLLILSQRKVTFPVANLLLTQIHEIICKSRLQCYQNRWELHRQGNWKFLKYENFVLCIYKDTITKKDCDITNCCDWGVLTWVVVNDNHSAVDEKGVDSRLKKENSAATQLFKSTQIVTRVMFFQLEEKVSACSHFSKT